ncbi:hypothetical protein DFH09DRAFT_1106091 [Mycena vulgaris]|nr:hypothetical protein DFH09DRAFT_1106091 [Mycena vulgaris]
MSAESLNLTLESLFGPILVGGRMQLCHRFYFWFHDVIAEYSLGVIRPQFKEKQAMIPSAVSEVLKPQKTLLTEHRVLPNPHRHQTQTDTFPLIDHIISRRQHGAEGDAEQGEFPEHKTNWQALVSWRAMSGNAQFFSSKHGASVLVEPTPAIDIPETHVTHVPDTDLNTRWKIFWKPMKRVSAKGRVGWQIGVACLLEGL